MKIDICRLVAFITALVFLFNEDIHYKCVGATVLLLFLGERT
jgi:hypothetical protein